MCYLIKRASCVVGVGHMLLDRDHDLVKTTWNNNIICVDIKRRLKTVVYWIQKNLLCCYNRNNSKQVGKV